MARLLEVGCPAICHRTYRISGLRRCLTGFYNGERQRSAERIRWVLDQQERRGEADRLHDREITRELRSRFTIASEQLANSSPAVRRSGVYAVAALADDWHGKGNAAEVRVCFEVLSGYLRESNPEFDEESRAAGPDGSVRATIVNLIADRRRSAEHWHTEQISMRGADLRGVDLSAANLASADLSRADLRFALLANCDLANAKLEWVDFSEAQLGMCDLSAARLAGSKFVKADMRSAKLVEANIEWTDFSHANLKISDLTRLTGYGLFTDADLSWSNLRGARLGGSMFVRTIVRDVDVADADLCNVTFGSIQVGDFKNLHKAVLSQRRREKYAEALAASRDRAEAEATATGQLAFERTLLPEISGLDDDLL
jgi:uncharacterized protein YjbI with pentapeptide repeats